MSVLTIGTLTPIRTIDPLEAMDVVSGLLTDQIFETPFRHEDADAQPRPVLFADHLHEQPAAHGGIEWCTQVQPNIRFSDGTVLTARLVAQVLGEVGQLLVLAEISARGETLVFAPRPGLSRLRLERELCRRTAAIALRGPGLPLGTGPHMLASSGDGGAWARLCPNPHARTKPGIEVLELRAYRDPDGLAEAVRRGEVGFTTGLPRQHVRRLNGVAKRFVHGTGTAILFFNCDRPALNVEVRRHLAQAIDQLALAEAAFGGAASFAAPGLLPPCFGSFFRPQQACVLAEHAPSLPKQLRLVTMWAPRPYLPDPKQTAELLAQQLAALGISVEVVHTSSAQDAVETVLAQDYDLFLGGWLADTPDPADFLHALLATASIPELGRPIGIACNLARFSSTQVDEALEAYKNGGDKSSLERALTITEQQAPVVPLMCGPTIVVHSWDLQPGELRPGRIGLGLFPDARP